MIKIAKDKKVKLNKLISYYRREYSKHNERFLAKNFIYDNDDIEICTIHTLSRIENNKTCSYDNIYFSLLDNLNIAYICEPKVDELIHSINLSLLKSAEINDSKTIIDRINKTINTLSPYLDYALYKEQAEIYRILLDYYCDYQFNTQLIDKHNDLFELVDEPLKPILVEITFICYTRIYLNADKAYYPLKKIRTCKSDSIITDYIYLLLYFREYKLTQEKDHAKKLIAKCKAQDNKFYLCKTYNILASVYTKQNPKLAISYLQLAIANFDNSDFIFNFANYIRNLATLACMNEQYDLAVENFIKLQEINPKSILNCFQYYIYSLEKTNSDITRITSILKYIDENSDKITSPIMFNTFLLFKAKYYSIDLTELEQIIIEFIRNKDELKNIVPILEIIEYELYSVCKTLNSFNLYKTFAKTFH